MIMSYITFLHNVNTAEINTLPAAVFDARLT